MTNLSSDLRPEAAAVSTLQEVINARDDDVTTYATLKARLDAMDDATTSVTLAGTNLSLQANGAAAAAQKIVTVDDSTGALAGDVFGYFLAGGTYEQNTVDTVDSAVQITFTTNIGTGGIPDNGILARINPLEQAMAGGYSNASLRMTGIDQFPGMARTGAAITAGASTFTIRTAPGTRLTEEWMLVNVGSADAELIHADQILGQTVTLPPTVTFANNHATDVPIKVGVRELNIFDFGPMGNNGTIDTALTAALAAATQYKFTIRIPPGTYYTAGGHTIPNYVRIIGAGDRSTLIYCNSATADVFDLSGADNASVGGFEIRPTVNRTAGTFFLMDGSSNCRLHDLVIRDPYNGIRLADSNNDGSGTYAQINSIERVKMLKGSFTGWQTPLQIHSAVSTTLTDISITPTDQLGGSAHIVIDSNVDTLVMTNVGAGRNNGGGRGLLIQDTIATSVYVPRWIRGSNCFFEGAVDTAYDSNCVHIIDGLDIEFQGLYTASGENGLAIAGGSDIRIIGGNDTNHDRYGVAITGGSNITIDGRTINSVSLETADTYDCIYASGTITGLNIVNCGIGRLGSPRYAILLSGAVTSYNIIGNRMLGSSTNRRRIVDSVLAPSGRISNNANVYRPTQTVTDTADTTPSVGSAQTNIAIAYTGAANLIGLDEGYEGQVVIIRFNNSNATAVNASGSAAYPFRLAGAANMTTTQYDTLTVTFTGSEWYEISRSVN